VSLVADADQIPEGEDHGGLVTLMTLHTRQGARVPRGLLTGLEENVFPHERSIGDERELEEERRLAYVGITRAEQRLYLTRAMTRAWWGRPAYSQAVQVPVRGAGPAAGVAAGRDRRRAAGLGAVGAAAGDERGGQPADSLAGAG